MWGTMMAYQLTLGRILERAGSLFSGVEIVSRRPDRSVFRYTYGDFSRRAYGLAGSLMDAGLRRGDRVATLMYNHHIHLEAFFGVPACGGVLHTINHRLHPNDIAYILNHAEDRFLIVDDVLLPVFEQIKGRVGCESVIVVPHMNTGFSKQYKNYEAFVARSAGKPVLPSLHENEAAIMCYTSGLAGSPKGVVYSHRALTLHSLALALPDSAGLAQRDVVLPLVPMHHANAWGLPIAATMVGCKQVFTGGITDPDSELELLSAEQVTLSAGVPTVWMGIRDRLEKEPGRWKLAPGLRAIVSGAAPPLAMIRQLDRLGIRLIQAWGLIESGPLATFATIKSSLENLPQAKKDELRATQGIPLPCIELRSIGDGGVAPHDGVTLGEAQLRGPWVASGYYNLPELRGKWTEDGWFRTGDVVTVDPNGYMKITDRAKDLIKSGNDWISSVDLENALMGHEGVQEAAVIAVQHPKWQERPLAVVVLKEGYIATADELRNFLAERFARWQLPDAIVFVPELPHTPTGKLLKKELRKQYRNWKWENHVLAAHEVNAELE
ncbi:MAG: long-chain fatty acid--CoA ligase [Terriglobales bacterium]